MKKLLSLLTSIGILIGFMSPVIALAACSPVALGGTGWCNLQSTFLLYGNGTSPIATSSALFWTNANSRLSFTNASSTNQNISGLLWLTALGTPAGTVLAVDPNGKVIATSTAAGGVTSVTGTYPVQSTGGATPAISLAFGTTTANNWSALQTFNGNASSTLFTASTELYTALASTTNLTISATPSGVLVTSATGAVSAVGAQTCTNQFFRSLSGAFVVGCATVGAGDVSLANLTATDSTLTFSGTYTGATARTIGLTVPVVIASGGTNATSFGTSGGIVAFNGTSLVNFANFTLTSTLATLLNASTTAFTCGTYCEMANGTAPSLTAIGQYALDTTQSQFLVATSTSFPAVFLSYRSLTVSYATSSWSGTTTIPLGVAQEDQTWLSANCYSDAGTTWASPQNGASSMNNIAVTSTVGTTSLTTNNAIQMGAKRGIKIGTPATTPTYVSCTIKYVSDRK